jgi:hypothetical protein
VPDNCNEDTGCLIQELGESISVTRRCKGEFVRAVQQFGVKEIEVCTIAD